MKKWAAWLGINRATLAVLAVVGGLGLSEEIWRNFLGIYLNIRTGDVARAAGFVGLYASLAALMEGFGYILGGTFAHRLGPVERSQSRPCRWCWASPSCCLCTSHGRLCWARYC